MIISILNCDKEYGIGKRNGLLFLLRCVPEVLIDVANETDQIAWFHLKSKITCIDFPELHQLVYKLGQSFYTTLDGLYSLFWGITFVYFIHCPTNDGQWCTEFMGHLCEEVGTEFRYFLLYLHLMLKSELFSFMTIECQAQRAYYNKV